MPGTSSSKKSPKPSLNTTAHKPFSWINDDVKFFPLADFVALTMDVSSGIQTCLELAYTSELDRTANEYADPGDEVLLAINSADADCLLRLSIAASKLLSAVANQKIDWVNKYGARETAGHQKGGA